MKSRKPKFTHVIAFNEYRDPESPKDGLEWMDTNKGKNAAKARRKKLRK